MTDPARGARKILRAGPLSIELEAAGIRYLRYGDREIVRRVYVAVRDGNWVTIPLEVIDFALEESADRFDVHFVADHRQGPVHFRWKGTIRGSADGTVRFEMDGEALSTFSRNRIGICVLHPIVECVGQTCDVEKVDGTTASSPFPVVIAPHQPFLDIHTMSYEVAPSVRTQITFEGDIFETEDQRNWSDASYKTYSTPLDQPKPVEVPAGTHIRQSVTVRLTPPVMAPAISSSYPSSSEIAFSLTGEPARPLPALGTSLSPRREPFTANERSLLSALRLAHLRADVVPSRHDFSAAFENAVAASASLKLPLELAIWVTESHREELETVARLVASKSDLLPLSAVLVLPLVRESSPPEAMTVARALFKGAPIAAGSNVHFTELNRNQTPVALADLLLFPSSPQVHMTDEPTIAENLGAIPWIAETARSFGGDRPIGYSPVMLRPPPCPPIVFGEEKRTLLPRHVDPRQASLLAAGWLAGHIGASARAGFSRATYFEATGWRGLMYGEANPRFVADFPAQPRTVFPVYHVLADLAEFTGGEVLGTRSSAPIVVEGVAVRHQSRTRLLLANLTTSPQTVKLAPEFVPGLIKRLDEERLGEASREGRAYRAGSVEERIETTVELAAHEVARIDVLT